MSKKMKKNRAGFTLPEMMIAVVILAMLMTAVAVAFQASVNSYSESQKMYNSINSARVALTRITNQLRTSSGVDTASSDSEISFIDIQGNDYTYSFDADSNRLMLITNDITSDTDKVLSEDVVSMKFVKKTETGQSGLEYVKYVAITIEVGNDDYSEKLVSAVVIRKNL